MLHAMLKKVAILVLSVLGTAVSAGDLVTRTAQVHSIDHGYEAMLINALEKIGDNRIHEALDELEMLTRLQPDFKLAQLVYGDLLLARSHPITDFGNNYNAPLDVIDSLREEARVRWQHHISPLAESRIPRSLVELNASQQYAIVVDLESSRLYLFENRKGVPELFDDFYVTIGKNGFGKYKEGDQKTPTGVYFITGFIEQEELPDLYGGGAFPLNYPNAWDIRLNRTGYGIWLHGTPTGTYNRPPRDSDGCVIVSNRDLQRLSDYITIGETPVVLAEQIDWLSRDEWQNKRRQFDQFVEQWRRDWESRDADRYLSHYSQTFTGLGNDYQSWVNYKRRVNPSKEYIRVKLSETSMFLYPGREDVLVVTFVQDYDSDNFQRRYVKRQYWQKEKDGKWRIIYEGSVS
jgi:murein L,D-transpeptidase YafK